MKVLFLSPSVPPAPSGNATTAGRIKTSLAAMGVQVSLARAAEVADPAGLARRIRGVDLVHVHHLVKAGRVLLPVPKAGWPPVAASAGGTDLMDLPPAEAKVRAAVLGLARRVLVPTAGALEALARAVPSCRERCRVVPRGVTLRLPGKTASDMFDLRSAGGARPGEVLFFLPAGFRAVKRPRFAIPLLERLRAEGMALRLVASGPDLEPAEAEAFEREAASRPWVRKLPPFPPEAAGAVYARADVVLNTSTHEGMSNALLEGMLAGRAVLASDLPANRAVVRDAETGLLFKDEAGFLAKARELVRSPELRARLGAAAREEAKARFSPEAEAGAVFSAWREALAAKPSGR